MMCNENNFNEDILKLEHLDLLPISPPRKRKKNNYPKIFWDVKKIREKREEKAAFLLKYYTNNENNSPSLEEKLTENEVKDIEVEAHENTDVPIQTTARFMDIFDTKLFGRHYYYDSANPILKGVSQEIMVGNFRLSEIVLPNIKNGIVLFKIIATSPDKYYVKQCYTKLIRSNVRISFRDVAMVFLNWGGSSDSLGFICEDQSMIKKEGNTRGGRLCDHNVEYILSCIMSTFQSWSSNDICTLIVMLISAAIDKMMWKFTSLFINLLSAAINNLEKTYIHRCACQIIKRFKTMEVLSAIYACIILIPVSDAGNKLSVKISFGLLRILLNCDFPNNDVLSVLNALDKVKNQPDDYFQLLYNAISLVENICVKRYDEKRPVNVQLETLSNLSQAVMDVMVNLKYTGESGRYLESVLTVKDLLTKLSHFCAKVRRKIKNDNRLKDFQQ